MIESDWVRSRWSRNGNNLGRFFPEVVDLATGLPRETGLDS